VEVQVVHRLATPRPDVGHDAVAALGDALRTGDLRGHREEPPHELRVIVGQVRGGCDVATGEEEDVRRGARGDVADRDGQLVLGDARGRDLAGHDAAEQARRVTARQSAPGIPGIPGIPGATRCLGVGAHRRLTTASASRS
jgi:hypothetical protein